MRLSSKILVKASTLSMWGTAVAMAGYFSVGSTNNAPCWCAQTPGGKTGLNSPTSEADANPLTASSKPAYIWLSSSLRRRLGIAGCCWQIHLCPSLFTCRRSPLSVCRNTLIKLNRDWPRSWVSLTSFPWITGELTLRSAETRSHTPGSVSARTVPAGACRSIASSCVSLLPSAV